MAPNIGEIKEIREWQEIHRQKLRPGLKFLAHLSIIFNDCSQRRRGFL